MREHDKYADMEYVRNNLDEKWNLFWLSHNQKLTVKDVETLILPNSVGKWCWNIISENINIQEIRNNPNKHWSKQWLSHNRQLTVKDIDTLVLPNNIHDWNWFHITININQQEIINNPNKPWHKAGIQNKICSKKVREFYNTGLLKHLQKNIPQFRYHTDMSVKCEY